jgi:transposase-like protein
VGLRVSDRGRSYRSDEEKRRILEASRETGASVSDVARRFGVKANLLFTRRRDPRFSEVAAREGFVPVEVTAQPDNTPIVDMAPEPHRRPSWRTGQALSRSIWRAVRGFGLTPM